MFQYEFEKRPPSSSSCDSRATSTTDWSRSYPSMTRGGIDSRDGRSEQGNGRNDPRDGLSEQRSGRIGSRDGQSESRSGRIDSRDGQSESRSGRIDPRIGLSDMKDSRIDPRGRMCTSVSRVDYNVERARRPLPPRPIPDRIPSKTTVPLKVWVIASASCFAVCAALVLATVVITKWGATYSREVIEEPEPLYANYYHENDLTAPETTETQNIDDNEIDLPTLEKLSIFKNMVASNRNRDLTNKQQIHPIHDNVHHLERKIEKKDKAHIPDTLKDVDLTKISIIEANEKIIKEFNDNLGNDNIREGNIHKNNIKEFVVPEFKPIQSVNVVKLPESYINNIKNNDYEEYYNDDNLYDDYMQSNSMTNYLIEKVQELHNWITSDPDFDKNVTKITPKTDFGNLLKALNESLVEGNITIVMHKLKDLYFGENYTNINSNRKVLSSNGTDLVSFGILTLDVMLLHNIQLMAWENQEAAKTKMLKDPDVFAFNALFMDPTKVEAKQTEVAHNVISKRVNQRQDMDPLDIGANLFENVIEVGVSAARAAIHLGRAYKNTKNILNQLSHHDVANIQNQISRNIDGNTHALNHLQTSFNKNETSVASPNGSFYTELDCIWLLYCRNLAATSKLNAPFGTMARINGMALRMLSGELSTDRALDTMLYEALSGWTELRCNDMFPKCSKVNAAAVVMDTILQPMKKPTKKGH